MSLLLQGAGRRTLITRVGPNRVQIMSKQKDVFLLRDIFSDTRAAGSVNGTLATPGPGTRVVADTDSKLSIGGGVQTVTADTAVATKYYGESFPRVPGTLIHTVVAANPGLFGPLMGAYDSTTIDANPEAGYYMRNGTLRIGSTSSDVLPYTSANVDMIVILRAAGAQYYSGSDLIWIRDGGTTDPLYYGENYGNGITATVQHICVIQSNYLSVPLASDTTFGATTDGAGHLETSGLGSGGSGKAWTDNKGTWSGGSASALSGGEAIRTVETGFSDVFADLDITRTAGNASLMLRYADDDNYLRLGTDGTNAILVEKVGGVENTLSTTAITYGAGNTMRIRLEGQSARVYYNDAFVVAESSIDASLTGTRHGLYTTDTGNSFDNIVVHRSTGHTQVVGYA